MIFDRNNEKQVVALLGAGSMGTAIVRRIGAGKKILLGDISAQERATRLPRQQSSFLVSMLSLLPAPTYSLTVVSLLPSARASINWDKKRRQQ